MQTTSIKEVGGITFRYQELAQHVLGETQRMVEQTLEQAREYAEICAMSERIYAFTDTCIQSLQQQVAQNSVSPMACAAGCSYCCRHLMVSCHAPELFAIVRFLESADSPLAVDVVRQVLHQVLNERDERFQHVLNRHKETGEGIACPFLIDHRCAIYPVRPIMCRGYNSYDLSCCQAYHIDPQVQQGTTGFLPQFEVASAVSLGLLIALAQQGLAGRQSLDLVLALQCVLDTPSAFERWMSGEPIFEGMEVCRSTATRAVRR
ncbi:MAG: YkgJ family cysteine cluster protein [Armatimonadota bacterium]